MCRQVNGNDVRRAQDDSMDALSATHYKRRRRLADADAGDVVLPDRNGGSLRQGYVEAPVAIAGAELGPSEAATKSRMFRAGRSVEHALDVATQRRAA